MQKYYVALLGNVDKSILKLDLGDYFKIEEWPIDKFVQFYQDMHDSAELDILIKIEDFWGYGYTKNVYVVTKTIQIYSQPTIREKDEWYQAIARDNLISKRLEEIILKLRLCFEGSIKICIEFFYVKEDKNLILDSSSENIYHSQNRIYKVNSTNIKLITDLLRNQPINTNHKYINFALENFNQSYDVPQIELEFISLMIALEALFNDGKQELRHKISRGCAILLGKTKKSSRIIFKDVRDLYDKRSLLVHTGDTSKINENDVILLKNYVRKSLLRLINLNISKQELSKRLIENGFGAYSKIQKHNKT